MTHRFPIKEIALQAGLGVATVDRVLNNRAHVAPQTRNRVLAAIDELEMQEQQMVAKGRRLFIDVIVEAPKRFSSEIKKAGEKVAQDYRAAIMRPRFSFAEILNENHILQRLDKFTYQNAQKNRHSHGLLVKLRDTEPVREKIMQIAETGMPIVAIFTHLDLPSEYIGYAGMDNFGAGRTAAYLMAKNAPKNGTILVNLSQSDFSGEDARLSGFYEGLSDYAPQLDVIEVKGGAGLESDTRKLVEQALAANDKIYGVYSAGGGNRAILKAFKQSPNMFIAHDLDAENGDLLAAQKIDYVLHHDIEFDLHCAFNQIAAAHGLLPRKDSIRSNYMEQSQVQIYTPENMVKLS